MDISGRTVLILGGAGLVGMAVARKLLELDPARVVVGGLTRREAEEAANRAWPRRGARIRARSRKRFK